MKIEWLTSYLTAAYLSMLPTGTQYLHVTVYSLAAMQTDQESQTQTTPERQESKLMSNLSCDCKPANTAKTLN